MRNSRLVPLVIAFGVFTAFAANAQETESRDPGPLDRIEERAQAVREKATRALDAVSDSGPHRRIVSDIDQAARHIDEAVARIDRHVNDSAVWLRNVHAALGPCGTPGAPPTATELPPPPSKPIPADIVADTRAKFDELEEARDRLDGAIRGTPPSLPRTTDAAHARLAALLDETDALLAERANAVAEAEWLRKVRDRLPTIDARTPPCELMEALLPIPGSMTLSESVRNPGRAIREFHEAQVAMHRVRIDRRAEAVRRGRWGLSIGTFVTPLEATEWEAVPVAAGSAERVIRQSGDDNRSGIPAAFVAFSPLPEDLHIPGPVRPYLELGTNLDADRPGFFIGGAFDIGPFMRLGVGYTMQRVEQLGEGLEEGSVLAPGQALRTEDDFDGDAYVSFTVALEKFAWFRLK